jgi:hypothetical protein
VSLPEIAGRLWRHKLAVLAVLVLAVGAAYGFKHAAPSYEETGTLVFVPPVSTIHPNPFEATGKADTIAAGAIAAEVMSPQGQQRVQQAGGTAQIDVGLVNTYDLEYPNYSQPSLTVTTTAVDPNSVQRTYTLVTNLLTREFTAHEVQANTEPKNRIRIVMAGDTGPLAQMGSSKRVLGALAILTLVAVFAVASFLERHPVRLSRLLSRTPELDRAQGRLPGIRRPGPAGPAARDY